MATTKKRPGFTLRPSKKVNGLPIFKFTRRGFRGGIKLTDGLAPLWKAGQEREWYCSFSIPEDKFILFRRVRANGVYREVFASKREASCIAFATGKSILSAKSIRSR